MTNYWAPRNNFNGLSLEKESKKTRESKMTTHPGPSKQSYQLSEKAEPLVNRKKFVTSPGIKTRRKIGSPKRKDSKWAEKISVIKRYQK